MAAVLVRGLPVPFWLTLVEALVRTAVYGLVLLTLVRPSVRFDPSLPSLRDLLPLLAAAVISSATIAGTYVSLLLASSVAGRGRGGGPVAVLGRRHDRDCGGEPFLLSIESRRSGATVRISLPTAEETQDG